MLLMKSVGGADSLGSCMARLTCRAGVYVLACVEGGVGRGGGLGAGVKRQEVGGDVAADKRARVAGLLALPCWPGDPPLH